MAGGRGQHHQVRVTILICLPVSHYCICARCRQCDLNIQDGQGRAPLHYAAARLDTSTLTSLVEAGAGVNTQDMLGNIREKGDVVS